MQATRMVYFLSSVSVLMFASVHRIGAADRDLVSAHTAGHEKRGTVFKGKLEDFRNTSTQVKKGECAVFVIRLAEDATITARESARLKLRMPGSRWAPFQVSDAEGRYFVEGPGMSGKVGIFSGGCATIGGTVLFQAHPYNQGGLGTGGFEVDLYLKKISKKEVVRSAATKKNAREQKQADNLNRACKRCEKNLPQCIQSKKRTSNRLDDDCERGKRASKLGSCRRDRDKFMEEARKYCKKRYDVCFQRSGISKSACGIKE